MAETENKKRYVDPITIEKKQAIVDASVQSMNKRPTSDETAMKKRFVQPIVNLDGTPCLADEVDRIATEANEEFDLLNKQAANFDTGLGVQLGLINNNKEAIEKAEGDISQLQIEVGGLSGIRCALTDLEDKVAYGKASSISVSVDTLTYEATFTLQADGGVTLSTAKIDLPLESMVVGAEYNKDTKSLILKLKNGESLLVPLEDVFAGLVSSAEKGAANGVASLDANGKVPAEQLPEDIGGINEEALKEYVKFTDYATASKAGVVMPVTTFGTYVNAENGRLSLVCAEKAVINDKSNRYQPIVPAMLDYAVKLGVTTNTETLTDAEKASACDWIGAMYKPAKDAGGYTIVPTINHLREQGTMRVSYTPLQFALVPYGERGVISTNAPTAPLHCANKKYVDDNKGTKLYRHVIYHEDDGGYPTNETIAISLSNTPYTSHSQIATDYLNGTILTLITSGYKVCGMNGTSAFIVDGAGSSELSFFLVPIVNDTITAL